MKKEIKVILVIIGTIIGAGFASGREIYLFFLRYGVKGLLGILISSLVTGVIIYITLKLIKKYEINNYNELLEKINYKYKKINKIINSIVNSFLLISFYIMVAGFSAYIYQTYNIPYYLSGILFLIFCFFIFLKDKKGMMKINEILVPVLITLILYLGLKNVPYIINYDTCELPNIKEKGFLISAILYSSYNSIILIPVLTSLKDEIKTKKEIKKISIISSIIIIILSLCIFGLLEKGRYYIENKEMPLIEILSEFGVVFKYIYGFVIIFSILTSAISEGYSFLKNVTKSKKSYNIALLLVVLSSAFVSRIGFTKLVELLYPIFGILGLIQITLIIKKSNISIEKV